MTIEYSDLLKFIIIGSCIIFAILSTSQWLINIILDSGLAIKPEKSSIILVIMVVVAYAIGPAVLSYFNDQISFAYHVGRSICIIIGSIFLYISLKTYSDIGGLNTRRFYNLVAVLTLLVASIGTTYGIYVRDKGGLHSITIKDNDTSIRTIENTRLVLFTSHHIVLFYSNTILLVPTGDIVEIRAAPNYPPASILMPIPSVP
jgi:hypothetical protein